MTKQSLSLSTLARYADPGSRWTCPIVGIPTPGRTLIMRRLLLQTALSAPTIARAYEPRNYAEDNWPYDDGDVTVYEGTEAELCEEAEFIFANAAQHAAGSYRRKVARNLADAIDYVLRADRTE